ncbi:MAG: ParB-like nuclease domain-containing protein [Clostridia bacterium]|nr:ParB-like nuclease domain-containing protein [Clostridia bacterium]
MKKGNASGIGTATHPEKHYEVFFNPDSAKKSRYKCIHYELETKDCKKLRIGCVGPSNDMCRFYCESIKPAEPNKAEKTAKPLVADFDGIKEIPMNEIVVTGKHFVKPSPEKVKALVAHYLNYGKLDKPIIVTCKNGKYHLEDKYLRYYVAKELKLKAIPAVTIETSKALKKLQNPGQKVTHKQFGAGRVVNTTINFVEIKFNATGKVIKFDINTCLKNNSFFSFD